MWVCGRRGVLSLCVGVTEEDGLSLCAGVTEEGWAEPVCGCDGGGVG